MAGSSSHPGVVAGGDGVGAQGFRPFQQRAEFQMPVAVDAGVRVPPAAYTRANCL